MRCCTSRTCWRGSGSLEILLTAIAVSIRPPLQGLAGPGPLSSDPDLCLEQAALQHFALAKCLYTASPNRALASRRCPLSQTPLEVRAEDTAASSETTSDRWYPPAAAKKSMVMAQRDLQPHGKPSGIWNANKWLALHAVRSAASTPLQNAALRC